MEGIKGTPSRLGRILFLVLASAIVVLGFLIYSGIRARTRAVANLTRAASEATVPTVTVVHPNIGSRTEEIVLPGNTQAFTEAPIYARTSGYLKRWYCDIGTRVKQGQLLAEIETPEIDQQLEQAQADRATAKANLNLAQVTADRLSLLLKTDSVSKQETDQAVSNLAAMKATFTSNDANVRRIEALQSFQKVYAPFTGIITARNTDIGALINAGAANAPGEELFHLAAIDTIRVYVAVPEIYSRAARQGATAALTLEEFPSRLFHGTLVRNANSIDPASRTLLVEVDVENRDGKLLPGAYVLVHLKLPEEIHSLALPANALLFRREGLRVGVIRNGIAELVPVTIGRDFGSTIEILSGLQATDTVIVNPSDSLISGTAVRIASRPGR